MNKETARRFMAGEGDFGLEAPTTPLSEAEQRLAALSMAFNAALVQFISEGIIPYEQQVHFMGHLQDFANRLYRGEALKLDGTVQTLKVNSAAGNLFFEAAVDALENGTANYNKMKELTRKFAEDQQAGNSNGQVGAEDNDKPTVH